ncbi:DUF4339 domain-containing protein [Persicirhabdus sediminis]|uniref:DUF4339 domain-containing protein n=1 Tax=Persicirhabdus sediminis TaxID=454144 RepID=A0A8J7SI57_9BACT|nr:DUF4339 domain-containing protein [Persicirhabdus sediminis]MBK1790211.1 DUF4339 domain-containing protein [Persicirhabdus sediminis]
MHDPDDAIWYYRRVGQKYGPVPLQKILDLAKDGMLHKELDAVWTKGMSEWATSGEVKGIHIEAKRLKELDSKAIRYRQWLKKKPYNIAKVNPVHLNNLVALIGAAIILTCVGLYGQYSRLFQDINLPVQIDEMLIIAGGFFAAVAAIIFSVWLFRAWHMLRPTGEKIPAWLAVLLIWIPGAQPVTSFFSIGLWPHAYNRARASHPQFRFVEKVPAAQFWVFCLFPWIGAALSPLVFYQNLQLEQITIAVSVFAFIYLMLGYAVLKAITGAINDMANLYKAQLMRREAL